MGIADKCKVCGQDVRATAYTRVNPEGDERYVVSVAGNLYLLHTDDIVCAVCGRQATWYNKVK